MTIDPRYRTGHDDEVEIVDLLDRLLDTGACINGDVLLSVAGIDLVWIGLRSIIASVETARPRDGLQSGSDTPQAWAVTPSSPAGRPEPGEMGRQATSVGSSDSGVSLSRPLEPLSERRTQRPTATEVEGSKESQLPGTQPRLELSEEEVERGLVQLVLTIVDLLRQLLERQAIARMEGGGLNDAEVERLGTTLARLAGRMDDLKQMFGLADEDLQLRLGPLARLD